MDEGTGQTDEVNLPWRTGYLLSRLLPLTCGLDLVADDDEEYDLVIKVSTGQMNVHAIHDWMKAG